MAHLGTLELRDTQVYLAIVELVGIQEHRGIVEFLGIVAHQDILVLRVQVDTLAHLVIVVTVDIQE